MGLSTQSTILLVDDDLEIREIARVLLESEGFSVVEAADGEATLSMFSSDIDLVILSVLQDCSASTDAPYIIISDNLTEYKFSPTDNGVIVTGTPDTREDFLSEDELLVINDTDFAKVVDGLLSDE